ncbi:MAG: 50S ribosomal protein L6 [Clostridiales bacterium]|jgi:large subunit ribosomal protein L6|nr:50S ribosomal protein L6 [Clostridiales bacterium]
MSRIGKLGIPLPKEVKFEYNGGVVTVTGPKGTLTQAIASKNIAVAAADGEVKVTRLNDQKESRAMHGLYRQLIANMVRGVVTPFSKTLIINGVGYKAAVAGAKLTMNIGFSHPVEYVAPAGITLACPDQNTVTVTGIDKELVGQVAATIKSKRKVEPYHLYGLRYSDEAITKKEGKTAGK